MKIITTILILIVGFIQQTASQQCQWALHTGSIGMDICLITNDSLNNIYTAGYYYNEFYSQNDTLIPLGRNDLYLSKYSADGQEYWAKTIGGLNPNSANFYEYREEIGGVIYNKAANCIYMCGNFYSSLTIDNHCQISSGEKDLFLSKFNLDGQCIWLKKVGSAVDDRYSRIYSDELGNVYWSCELKEPGVLDTLQLNTTTPLIKFSESGELKWVKQITNSGIFQKMIIKENILYFIATFSGNLTIDTISLVSINTDDYIIGKYNLITETISWIKQLSGNSTISDIIINDSMNIYFTGGFEDSLVIDNLVLTNMGNTDNYYLKLDTNGGILWNFQTNSLDHSSLTPCQLFKGFDNSIYAAGSINSRSIFGQDTIYVDLESGYVTRFDHAGNFYGTITFGEARNTGLLLLNDGSVVVSGIQIGETALCDTVYSNFPGELAGYDNYLAKFNAITGMQTISKPKDDKLFIYANPTTGLCNINIPTEFEYEKHLVLYVYDQQGRLLKQTNIEMSEETIKLNMEALAKGMYTAVLSNGKKQFSGKIIFN